MNYIKHVISGVEIEDYGIVIPVGDRYTAEKITLKVV